MTRCVGRLESEEEEEDPARRIQTCTLILLKQQGGVKVFVAKKARMSHDSIVAYRSRAIVCHHPLYSVVLYVFSSALALSAPAFATAKAGRMNERLSLMTRLVVYV